MKMVKIEAPEAELSYFKNTAYYISHNATISYFSGFHTSAQKPLGYKQPLVFAGLRALLVFILHINSMIIVHLRLQVN